MDYLSKKGMLEIEVGCGSLLFFSYQRRLERVAATIPIVSHFGVLFLSPSSQYRRIVLIYISRNTADKLGELNSHDHDHYKKNRASTPVALLLRHPLWRCRRTTPTTNTHTPDIYIYTEKKNSIYTIDHFVTPVHARVSLCK